MPKSVGGLHPGQWVIGTISMPPKPVLTTADVCRLFGKSDKTLAKMVREGRFPPPKQIDGVPGWTNWTIGIWMAWVAVKKG